jgi:hypothetical protein
MYIQEVYEIELTLLPLQLLLFQCEQVAICCRDVHLGHLHNEKLPLRS